MQSKKYWNLKKKLKKIYYKIFIHYIHYFCASFYKKMEDQMNPMMYMLLSSMKMDNENTFIKYLMILMVLLPIISKIIPFYDIKEYIKDYLLKKSNYISITISSHEVPVIKSFSSAVTSKLIYSKDFLSIIHYITENKIKNFKSLTEIMVNNSELNSDYSIKNCHEDNKFIFIPLHNNKILISENEKIYFQIELINNKDKEENKDNKKTVMDIKHNNFNIILSTNHKTDNGIDILKKFIERCKENYIIFQNKNKDDNKQYIFEYKSCEKSDESQLQLIYKEYLMEHNKDLSVNIFFEDKDRLMNYINPFIYDKDGNNTIGEEKYKRSGYTFKAGLLFYGSPGCGKTSTIKGILKYTNRHGIIINLNKVKTCEELELIFRNRVINKKEFNGKQLCYILEDCDAFNNDIISSRKRNEEDIKKNNDISEISKISQLLHDVNDINVKQIIKKEDDSLNLSCFLNVLDGIIELYGVMIIMTTNHPEKIDEALIRNGRFDFKYEFKKASKKIILEMIQFNFNLTKKEMETYSEHINIKDEILSQAEIQSICFQNNDVKKCIEEIILASQK